MLNERIKIAHPIAIPPTARPSKLSADSSGELRKTLDQLIQIKICCTVELTGSHCWPFFLVLVGKKVNCGRGGISTL